MPYEPEGVVHENPTSHEGSAWANYSNPYVR